MSDKSLEDAEDFMGKLVQDLIRLERSYYFEKRNVKTERQKKVREILERYGNKGA